MLTRVSCQSYKPNKKGFHVFSEEGFKINNNWNPLLHCSINKVPNIFIEIDVEDKLYNLLTINEIWGTKKYPKNSNDRKLGFALLKKLIIEKYGVKKKIK